jgi:hypothetical protein
VLQIAISVLQKLLHQHVKQVQCFVHSVVHFVRMTTRVSKNNQLKVLVVLFFPLALLISNEKVNLP